MSIPSLSALEHSKALEPTRRFEELALYHVPFDELNGDTRTETALVRLVMADARVSVIGSSGSGKSSLISASLGPMAGDLSDEIVPIRVPVAAAVDDAVVEPDRLARHIVKYITRWSSPAQLTEDEKAYLEQGVAETARRAGDKRVRQFHIGMPLWLAHVEFARQVESVGTAYDQRPGETDAIETLKRLVELFAAHGLALVLVMDDSDAWLSVPGFERSVVATGFFDRSLRMLVKEINCALVLAVHSDYLELPAYKGAREWLSGEVAVPRLIDARLGLETILRDRLVMADLGFGPAEVVSPDGLDQIAKFYEGGKTLRDVLRVLQRGLQNALSDGYDVISTELVDQAVAELNR